MESHKKWFRILGQILFGLFALELLFGYFLFQKNWTDHSAILWALRGVAGLHTTIDDNLPTIKIGQDSKGENPFLSYHSVKGYKIHPFIDFSGVHTKKGPEPLLDYFGFRNKRDLYFSKSDEILVVMTGGSELAGFSHTEPIADKVEDILNKSGKLKFRVLNLGMNSYTLSNEINVFTQLAWHLHPRIVITHSGYNDLFYGRYVPPNFKKLGLVYFKYQELWLPRLYDLKEGLDQSLLVNPEGDDWLVDAYFANIEKYRRLVQSAGGILISGIQPLAIGALPETTLSELHSKAEKHGSIVLERRIAADFIDHVHTTDETANRIAQFYAGIIREKLK